jgi:hypothetical protein
MNYLSALDDGILVGHSPTGVAPAILALLSIGVFAQSEAEEIHYFLAAVEEVLPQGKVTVILLLFLHLLQAAKSVLPLSLGSILRHVHFLLPR